MPDNIPRIDVVVTVIYCGEKVLVVYNDSWGGFAPPMTKLRRWPLGFDGTEEYWETGADAAVRNVGECLGITSTHAPGLLADVGSVRQSTRTGTINSYLFQVYGYRVEAEQVGPGIVGEWLLPSDLLDPERRPISPTAQILVKELGRIALDRKSPFPPAPPRESLRQSTASVAIIRRERAKRKQWLLQWNKAWGRYFLVGGHAHVDEPPRETPIDCIHREVEEELGLARDTDFHAEPYQRAGEQVGMLPPYRAWSTSKWQDTEYAISPFQIRLEDIAYARIDGDMANRWVTKREILFERCADGRLISPTTRMILRLLGEL